MPRHSHFTYELYVRIVYTIFGGILVVANCANRASYSAFGASQMAEIVPINAPPKVYLDEKEIRQLISIGIIGIIAAISSSILTNGCMRNHNDTGIFLTCLLHIGIDFLTIAIAISALPK